MNILKDTLMPVLNDYMANILALSLEIATLMIIMYIGKAFSKIKAETSKIKNDDAREKVDKNLSLLEKMIKNTIMVVESSTKKELIKDIADGKMSKDSLESLKKLVISDVKTQLGSEGLQVLNSAIGDLDSYIETYLESTLEKLKSDGTIERTDTQIKNEQLISDTKEVLEDELTKEEISKRVEEVIEKQIEEMNKQKDE